MIHPVNLYTAGITGLTVLLHSSLEILLIYHNE